jgi:NADH:ubiquinone oxidoreductase subunit 2 (subunit N)
MYMRDEPIEAPVAGMPASLVSAVAISLIATIYLGVLPNWVLDNAIRAAQDLMK